MAMSSAPWPPLAPPLLLVAALLCVVARSEQAADACPSVPTLSSNCSAHGLDADWCILWPGGANYTDDCAAEASKGADDCSWMDGGIVEVDGLPFDCEKLCVLRLEAAPLRASLTPLALSSDLSNNSISRVTSQDLGVMETSALVQMCVSVAACLSASAGSRSQLTLDDGPTPQRPAVQQLHDTGRTQATILRAPSVS